MTFINHYYSKVLKYDLINKFQYYNVSKVPTLKKIILSYPFQNFNIKKIIACLQMLEFIVGKKVLVLSTKKPIIFLKIKKGFPSGCKIVLKNNLLNASFIKIIFEILPHIEQAPFNLSLKNKNFLSVTLSKSFFTSELNAFYIYFKEIPTINLSFVFNTSTVEELKFLLSSYKINTKVLLKS
jgi:ribosomal protein L5